MAAFGSALDWICLDSECLRGRVVEDVDATLLWLLLRDPRKERLVGDVMLSMVDVNEDCSAGRGG